MMFFGPAELTSEPVRGEFDGIFVYTADATLRPSGRPIVAVMHPPVAGMALPYVLGSLVLVGGFGGTGYVTGEFVTVAEHDGNTLIAARSAGKDVILGSGSEAQALMLYTAAHDELTAMRSAMTSIVLPKLGALLTTAGDLEGAEACTNTLSDLLSPAYHGGDPSSGAKGKKA